MKARRSLISRIASIFRKAKPDSKAQKPTKKEPRSRGIEPLEGRIAPASLIDASTIQYKDVGGDIVTVKFSEPLFTIGGTIEQSITLNNLDDIFKFSAGTFASDVEQDLQMFDLTKVKLVDSKNPADGISFTVETTSGTGDGSVKLGAIRATNITLGNVLVDGDLGQIDVGAAASKIAIKSLTVDSLYANNTASQLPTIGAADALESKIVGGVGLLHVKGDLFGYFHVIDGNSIVNNNVKTTAPGNITKVIVEGSLRGKETVAATSDNTGSINAQGTIGSVEVLGVGDDANTGGLIGGGGRNSGSIIASKEIKSVTVADSLKGGGGLNSGSIISSASVGKVTIGDDIVGGTGNNSGSVQGSTIKQLTVSDSILGGNGDNSGSVISAGLLSKFTVANDIVGGDGKSSGNIRVGVIGKGVVEGTITGGDGLDSGVVFADDAINSLAVNEAIVGGEGIGSGGVFSNGLVKSVVVAGQITGGVGDNSGFIGSASRIASVKVEGAVNGGEGHQSGRIYSGGSIDKVEVQKLVGGNGDGSGSILAASDPAIGGIIKSATVALGLQGGEGQSSGTILSLADLGRITIGNRSQPAGLVGGGGDFSGSIVADGSIKKPGVLIYGSVEGGAGNQSGLIQANGDAETIVIRGAVKGVDGLTGEASGIVRVGGQLKSLVVDGGLENASVLVGADLVKAVIGTGLTDSTISAFGAVDPKVKSGDIAIGSITVDGNVSGSQILAGYDLDGDGLNADASIKFVKVTGNWTASDLVAGVIAIDGQFGNEDDAKISGGIDRDGYLATIAKIQIQGSVSGSTESDDQFGFVAEQIEYLQVGATKLAFTDAAGQVIDLPGTDDVTAREVTA